MERKLSAGEERMVAWYVAEILLPGVLGEESSERRFAILNPDDWGVCSREKILSGEHEVTLRDIVDAYNEAHKGNNEGISNGETPTTRRLLNAKAICDMNLQSPQSPGILHAKAIRNLTSQPRR